MTSQLRALRTSPSTSIAKTIVTLSSVAAIVLVTACADADGPVGPDPAPEGPVDYLALDACDDDVGNPTDGVDFESVASAEQADVMCGLRALDALVADRDVICLGEGSHGVSQSNAWREHFVRYLVHAHGFRTVVFESSSASMLLADDYVQTGEIGSRYSSFDDARGSLGSTVEAEEFLDAMRALQLELEANDSADRLQMRGLDIAVQPSSTRRLLFDYIAEVEAGELEQWEADLPDLVAGVDFGVAGDAAQALVAQLNEREAAYVDVAGEEAWTAAVINAENLRDGYRFLELYFDDQFLVADATYREPSMVKNLERVRANAPGGKMIILAHNKHCHREDFIGRNLDGDIVPVFGTALAESLGDDYGFIAQLYAEGEERVIGGDIFPVFVQTGALETAMTSLTSEAAHLVSVDTTRIALDQEWPFNASVGVVADQMDGIFWIRTATPVTIR